TLRRQVEFNHCDPAGIVFYPRYFEMISALTERFFADGVGHSWARMAAQDGAGTPLGAINIRFLAPSRLEDWLDFTLQIKALGSASATFALTCSCAGETRFTGEATVIHARLSQGHSSPWPDAVRRAMARYLLTPPDTKDS
ncbi:acyl-CoA thioesterase, partial [Phaeovulum sp. W22_SRMD_FR3]|uniref:acyl-CoA thioesterase n=1 Tax=Phaeovulum sp. W22_SRMD_FR3 TaxID=3240274 RepID=UPI003F9DBE36